MGNRMDSLTHEMARGDGSEMNGACWLVKYMPHQIVQFAMESITLQVTSWDWIEIYKEYGQCW